MTDLAVIIVSWNVRDLLQRCVESIHRSLAGSPYSSRIVVVDNASSDDTAAMLRARFPEVELIEPGENLGFAAANNRALGAVGASARYLMLLNPDTEVLHDAIPRLIRFLDTNAQFDVVGPQLRYGDGRLQSSRRRFPTAGTFFWESTPLEQWWPNNPWARRYRCEERSADNAQPVGWLVGAALLVRSSSVGRAGLLDERFFMYSEELEWQWRIQGKSNAHPSRIVYLPQAVVLHYEGSSSAQVPAARHIYFQRSKIRLAQLRHGRALALALRLFLLGCYAAQLAAEAAKLAVGHRPALRHQRIDAYRAIIRSGLS